MQNHALWTALMVSSTIVLLSTGPVKGAPVPDSRRAMITTSWAEDPAVVDPIPVLVKVTTPAHRGRPAFEFNQFVYAAVVAEVLIISGLFRNVATEAGGTFPISGVEIAIFYDLALLSLLTMNATMGTWRDVEPGQATLDIGDMDVDDVVAFELEIRAEAAGTATIVFEQEQNEFHPEPHTQTEALTVNISEGPCIGVALRAALEGAYPLSPVQNAQPDLMMTYLNMDGLLPYGQPFGVFEMPLRYEGNKSVSEGFFSDNPGIVDWVVLGLRESAEGGMSARRAALLRNDGHVVDTDGESAVQFCGVAEGSYFASVYHWNHIPIMSSMPLSLMVGESNSLYDLTAPNAIYGGGASEVEPGVFALAAGDANQDWQVTAPDFNSYLSLTLVGEVGYGVASDYNLDGQVTASDFNLFLKSTSAGAQSTVPPPP